MKHGSLFSGYGGLDLAVNQVFGSETVWVSDVEGLDKHGRKVGDAPAILAHRFPGVPNIGDITTVDWSQVEPVDIISGGSPCQDISTAGKRAGMVEGTRSNLWVAMRDAIAYLKPAYVVWENVYGALSARAASAMESDPRLLGDHRHSSEPVLRALGRVLGDLAELGFDAEWHSLRAADVGLCHGRARVFVVAAHPDRIRPVRRRQTWGGRARPTNAHIAPVALLPTPVVADARGSRQSTAPNPRAIYDTLSDVAHSSRFDQYAAAIARHEQATGHLAPDPTEVSSQSRKACPKHGDSTQERPREDMRGVRGFVDSEALQEREAGGSDCLSTADPLFSILREQSAGSDSLGASMEGQAISADHMPAVRHNGESARSPRRQGLGERRPGQPDDFVRELPPEAALAGGSGRTDGRDCTCRRRLSAEFASWMMGLPPGWVTDVPDMRRNWQLHALGNGVVPQQAAHALRVMLARAGWHPRAALLHLRCITYAIEDYT